MSDLEKLKKLYDSFGIEDYFDANTSHIADLDEDFDELLTIARDLRNRIDSDTRRSEFIVFLAIMIAASSVLFAIYLSFNSSLSAYSYTIPALGIVYGALPLLYYFRIKRKINQNKRALTRIVVIIAEVLATAANKGNWPSLKRARYEIALASLDY